VNKLKNLFNWFGWKSKLTLMLLINGVIAYYGTQFGFYLAKDHSISKLPNSCFVDSVAFASYANYILSSKNTWAQIYAFQYHYTDELNNFSTIFNKNLIEYTASIPKYRGHSICVFEYKGILWVYDSNHGTMPVGVAGNRSEYQIRITKWIEKKYKAIVFHSILIDDDAERTKAWIEE
jgi:hypothetical protein